MFQTAIVPERRVCAVPWLFQLSSGSFRNGKSYINLASARPLTALAGLSEGPFTYDVPIEGKGGIGSKVDDSTERLRDRTLTNPNFLWMSYVNGPFEYL